MGSVGGGGGERVSVISRPHLIKTFKRQHYKSFVFFLERTFLMSCRRICDEDDDLAEVTPETVPDEVREWLAATFTRQPVPSKREKPKFKSVANAIRTGIFFDK